MKLGAAINVASWIKAARVKAGITQDRLGELMGVTKANISAWENARHEPSYEQLKKISKETGHPLPVLANASPIDFFPRKVPLISYVHAGQWKAVMDSRSVDDCCEFVAIQGKWSGNAFAMRIQGNSMEPTYREGELIVVDPDASLKPGCMVVAVNADQEAVFRQFKRHRTDEHGRNIFKLVPLNDAYETVFSDEHQMRVIGPVVEHHRFPY